MKKISYLLLAVLLLGCKSTKQTTQIKSDISERKDIELSEKKENNMQISEQIETREDLDIARKVIENMLFTIWSAPDSLGKQYPVATGEINRQEHTEQTGKKNTSVNTETSVKDKEQTDFRDKTKTDSKSDVKEMKETKKQTPAWMIWSALVIVSGLIVYVVRFIKR